MMSPSLTPFSLNVIPIAVPLERSCAKANVGNANNKTIRDREMAVMCFITALSKG